MMAVRPIFEIERDDDVLVVSPRRNVTSLADAEVQGGLGLLLGRLDEAGVRHAVFDFAHVEYFGSTMLEAMLVIWNKVHPAGGRQALCNVSDIGREIVHIANFDRIWPICGSREEALGTVRTAG